jgi:hypothetical protein
LCCFYNFVLVLLRYYYVCTYYPLLLSWINCYRVSWSTIICVLTVYLLFKEFNLEFFRLDHYFTKEEVPVQRGKYVIQVLSGSRWPVITTLVGTGKIRLCTLPPSTFHPRMWFPGVFTLPFVSSLNCGDHIQG